MGLEDVDSHMYTKKCQHQLLNYIYIQFLKINYLIKVGNKLIFKISQIEKKKKHKPIYHWHKKDNVSLGGVLQQHICPRSNARTFDRERLDKKEDCIFPS